MIAPCKDCLERCVACHATCERYRKWRADFDTFKEKVIDAKIKEADVVRRRNEAVVRMFRLNKK